MKMECVLLALLSSLGPLLSSPSSPKSPQVSCSPGIPSREGGLKRVGFVGSVTSQRSKPPPRLGFVSGQSSLLSASTSPVNCGVEMWIACAPSPWYCWFTAGRNPTSFGFAGSRMSMT
jgi:hypothetical protein